MLLAARNLIHRIKEFIDKSRCRLIFLLAKAQLEAQLAAAGPGNISSPSLPRAGPKGQFIWPPVSVQSSMPGTVSIRADRSSTAGGGGVPVSQLAQVFDPRLPQEPVPFHQLGLNLAGTQEFIDNTTNKSDPAPQPVSPSHLPATLPSPSPAPLQPDSGTQEVILRCTQRN